MSSASESPAPVEPVDPPRRNLMGALTTYATIFAGMTIFHGATDILQPEIEFFYVAVWGALVVFSVWGLWRAWTRPDYRTDRIVLLVNLGFLGMIPLEIITSFAPELWYLHSLSAGMVALFPFLTWSLRRLDEKWTREGDMFLTADGKPWPTDSLFYKAFCFFLFLHLTSFLTLIEGEDFGIWVVVTQFAALGCTWIVYLLGRSRFQSAKASVPAPPPS